MKTAIVLSGGGSKGAYEIGVWKALQKLHITYDIVTGTSVGALNGAFMVQRQLKAAEWMWDHINFNMVFSNFEANYHTLDGKAKILKHYMEGILFHGGAEVSALEGTIKKYINAEQFYQSNIDYGLVTIDFTDLKPLELQKKDIPVHLLCDYLMASATCYPAFQKKKIGKHHFIDGGYYDNLPINLALQLGARKVIAVNIGKKGEMKPISDSEVEITFIEPRNDLGSFLIFDQKLSQRAKMLGYNDTMKVFKKYEGNLFTFQSHQLKKFVKKYYSILQKELNFWLKQLNPSIRIPKQGYYHDFLNTKNQEEKKQMLLEIVEDLGLKFELDETRVYQEKGFNKLLKEGCLKYLKEERNILDRGFVLDQWEKISDQKTFPLSLSKKISSMKSDSVDKIFLSSTFLFQKEFIEALYLTLLQ